MGYRDKYADEIEGLFCDLENRIMLDIVRRIKKEGQITSTADYQLGKLAELGYSSDEIETELRKALNASYGDIWKLYDDVVEQEYTRNKTIYEQINGHFVPYEENEQLQQQIEAAKKQAGSDLENLTKTLGIVETVGGQMTFLPLTEYYRKALTNAVIDISSGAFDYNSVLKRTVNTLVKSGIRTIDYASGYNSRLPVAVRRAIMTGVSQMVGEISEMNAQKLGTEYFEVTHHSGARPSHRRWQGRVYSRDELVSVCGLGEKTGLKGINCYHDYYPFIPGVSKRKYSDEWLKDQDRLEDKKKIFGGKKYTAYEARQKQRQMETSMRAQRQKVKLMQEGGADLEDIVIAKARYQGQLQEYRKFSNAMGLKAQTERIYIDGLGKVANRKSPKALVKDLISKNIADSTSKNVSYVVKTGKRSIRSRGIKKDTAKHKIPENGLKPLPELREYKTIAIDQFKTMKHSIKREERSVIYGSNHFTGYINSSNARKINGLLRKGEKLPEGYQKITDVLQNVVNKNRIKDDIIVTRYVADEVLEEMTGVRIPAGNLKTDIEEWKREFNDIPNKIKAGKVYTEKGFLSTSAVSDKNVFTDRRRLRLDIKVPAGTNGYVSTNNRESEVIFGQNTKLKILGCRIEDGSLSRKMIVLDCIITR